MIQDSWGEQMSVKTELLKSQGIENAESFLAEASDNPEIGYVDQPEVATRGSIHLMLGRIVSIKEVMKRLSALRHV